MEGFFLLLLLIALYLLPTIVAVGRRHHNAGPVFVVNLFLGWVLVGWVVALAWALTAVDESKPPPKPLPRLEPAVPAAKDGKAVTAAVTVMALLIVGAAWLVNEGSRRPPPDAGLQKVLVELPDARKQTSTAFVANPDRAQAIVDAARAEARRHKDSSGARSSNNGTTCSVSAVPMPEVGNVTSLKQCHDVVRAYTKAIIANVRVTATCREELVQRNPHLPSASSVRHSSRELLKMIPGLEQGAERQLKQNSTLEKCRQQLSAAQQLVRLQPELRGVWR